MKTILLTGADGFIGTRLANELSAVPATRLLRLLRTTRTSVARDTFYCGLEELTASFWEENGVESIDTIFHVAGFAPKNRAEASCVPRIVGSNIRGLAALLESLPSAPQHLIFTSSIDVYHRSADAIDEQSRVSPETLFGASKVFGEQLVRDFAAASGSRYSIARLGHIFGPGEERYQKLIPNLIWTMLRGQVPVLRGTGSTTRDFLYVDDAANALVLLMEQAESVDPINVVRGEATTILQIAQCLAEIIGYRGAFQFEGSDELPLHFNAGKMHALVDITSFTSLRKGLKREVEYFKALRATAQSTYE